jgi:sugar-specific transcriptional regulator TrmB
MAKGKSVADKRAIILGIFHEKKEPFLLKEIEKLASKKGVVLQSVQEILKTLTDDDLVKTDKIGTTNWFWSFPSEHATKLEQKKNQCDAELKALEKQLKKIEEDIENEKTTNKENDASSSAHENAKLLKELAKLEESNPELQEQVAKGVDAMRGAADRWTDNLFLVKSWVDKKMGDKEQTKAFFKQQGVDLNTLDYVQ